MVDQFIRKDGDRYFYVERRLPEDGNSRNFVEETEEITDPKDLEMIDRLIQSQAYMQSSMAMIPCWNPECNEVIITTKEQKRDFQVRFYKKYGKIMLPFCCKGCRDRFYEMMTERETKSPAGDLE